MDKAKPTPGPWVYVAIDGSIINPNGINDNKDSWHVAELTSNDGCLAANGNLIAEAGTVYHETNLTPRQLLEQRDALISVMRNFCNWAMDVKNGADLHPGRLEDYRIGFAETIAKTKQVQG